MYDLVIERYPESKQHADALLAAARLQAKLKQTAAGRGHSTSGWPRIIRSSQARRRALRMGMGLQELGKPEEADRLFERLHKEYPQSRFWADATCRLAQQALDAKDYRQAGKLVDEVLESKPTPPIATSRSDAQSAPVCHVSCAARSPWPRPTGRKCAKRSRRWSRSIPTASGGRWPSIGSPRRTIVRRDYAAAVRAARTARRAKSGESANRGWR